MYKEDCYRYIYSCISICVKLFIGIGGVFFIFMYNIIEKEKYLILYIVLVYINFKF